MARSNIVGLICGARGTGKTDFLKSEIIMPSPFQKKLIVDTFDSPVWHNMKSYAQPELVTLTVPVMQVDNLVNHENGLYRMFSSDTDSMMQAIQLHARNSLLIFEDATKYIGSRLTPDLKKFILDSKQKNLDVFFVFHSLAQVPPDLVRCADILTLFKTNEGVPSQTKYPFPQIPKMMEIVRSSENHYENITTRLN